MASATASDASRRRARSGRWPGRAFALALLLWSSTTRAADEVYLAPDRFVAEAFGGSPPAPQIVWLSGALREDAQRILGHAPEALRLRYWRQGPRSAWILDEIGKDQPITAGIVVDDGRLERLRVLIYRESRGWEIRHDFFTRQFDGAALTPGRELDRRIDNISGATLSVQAMQRLARLALRLHAEVAGP
ncbi:FMN-binding protein [Fontimonas sp. SYSU GA230001]|uniref:FMN-binding protein n=1 Tax=Fontimonas sp. SYSU GA230001 TaxID=3142450 RepID=UPI0032B4F5AC